MKRVLSIFFSLSLLFSLTACNGTGNNASELTQDQIQEKLEAFAADFPKVSVNAVSLSQAAGGETPEYAASFDLTWEEKSGRFSAERHLDQYSRTLAANVLRNTPSVSNFDVKWMIPYHSENEIAMAYTFERRKDVMWQTDLYDRFTDGSFGADAFLEDPQDMGSPMPPGTAVIAAMTPQDAQQALSRPASTVIMLGTEAAPQAVSSPKQAAPAAPVQPLSEPQPQEEPAAPQEPEAPVPQAEQSQQPQQAASVPQQQTQSPAQTNPVQAAQIQSSSTPGAVQQQSPTQPAQSSQQKPTQSANTANQNTPSGVSLNAGRLSEDGTTDINGRAIYVTKSGECWHYDNNCNQGTYYPPEPGEIEQKNLRPCDKCVL